MTDGNSSKDRPSRGAKADGKNALPAAAQRALDEAAARREEYRMREAALPKEVGTVTLSYTFFQLEGARPKASG